MEVAVVGAGRVGTALAVLLQRAGHRVTAVAGREATVARAAEHLPGVPVLAERETSLAGELVLVSVPDDEVAPTATRLAEAAAFRPGAWVAHVSGALGLDVLTTALASGARRLAIHPLVTVPDVGSAIEGIAGAPMAVTADDEEGSTLGERLAIDVGARPFRLADERRPLYHAAAVFASNYLVTLAGIAEELFGDIGVPDPAGVVGSLARASLANVGRLGPAAALTGPAVRGDAGTVARNLAALRAAAPQAVAGYVELCRLTLDLGERGGRLSAEDSKAVEEVLTRWR
ncbi:MAG: Rossmann-like and DUF2520 domain-containing protein [Actinomycetota bacterium]